MQKLAQTAFVLVMVLMCGQTHAAAVDEALVTRFEAAHEPRQQQKLAIEIHQRLGEQQPADHLRERVIEVLVSRPSLGHSRYISILEKLGAPESLSESSINAIAAGLVTDGISHDWPAYQTLRETLTAYQRVHGLPDQAFARLLRSLDEQRPYWMVIEVLASTDAADPRHYRALSAVADALAEHGHYGIRSAAIAGLDRMAGGDRLPERALSILQNAALSDEYISVRLEAMELLEKQALDETGRRSIGESLAQELTTPTPGLWQRAPSNFSLAERYARAIDLLARLYRPPYPAHVIDAFIAQTRSFAAERCIELLRDNRPPDGFSDAQRKNLELMAARHHNDALRAALFELVAPRLDAASLAGTLEVFQNDRRTSARLAAGFALKNHFAKGAVPGPVVEAAAGVIRDSKDQKLQHVSASLIARGSEEFPELERRLLVALRAHGPYANVYHGFVELYGEERFSELVIRYATDTTVPVWFRAQLIFQLGQRATPDATLPENAKASLLQTARETFDYRIINAVQSALTAWRVDIPVIVHLKAERTHSSALFVLLVLCALVNLGAGLLVLFRLLTMPLKKGASTGRRAAMALGWTGLSFGVLVLFGFGVIGFIGHNSMPDPRDTLQFQIPAYVGTVVYLIIAWFVFVSTRREPESSAGQAGDGTGQPEPGAGPPG